MKDQKALKLTVEINTGMSTHTKIIKLGEIDADETLEQFFERSESALKRVLELSGVDGCRGGV